MDAHVEWTPTGKDILRAYMDGYYNPNDELQTQFYGGTNATGIPAGGVYQDSPHNLCGNREEVRAVLPRNISCVDQADIHFVD